MRTEELDYELPGAAIARHPCADREGARLLVVGREEVLHRQMREWCELVPSGALVVLNDTRVLPARLHGVRSTGGKVEIFLLERLSEPGAERVQRWAALGRASKPLRVGTRIACGLLAVQVRERRQDGTMEVELSAAEGVESALYREGQVPLPPYLGRPAEPSDVERYQTVFARHAGSVAAPTAGLHLSERTLARLAERGVQVAFSTLHVGLGTFRPVSTDDLDQHLMHAERYQVSPVLVEAVAAARSRGAPVVAVGTTVVRALESAALPDGSRRVSPCDATTRLLIQPGHRFRVVDALLTNFHMPKSTLLALVAAFAGLERVRQAYASALRGGYRFLSYGDAMWIPEAAS